MGDISKHFSTREARCNCLDCQSIQVDPIVNMHLVTLLEAVHSHFSKLLHAHTIIDINSWNRCSKHNDNTPGSSKKSRHVLGLAADIVVRTTKDRRLIEIAPMLVGSYVNDLFPDHYGIGIYADDGFTHLDVDTRKWRKGFPGSRS